MVRGLRAFGLVALLASGAARAEADSFYLGDGHDGALNVSTEVVINKYGRLLASVTAGDSVLSVSNPGDFPPGRLLMVLQTTGLLPEPASGPTSTLNLNSADVGRFELGRVASNGGNQVTLTEPLIHSFAANASQVITVPEYSSVTMSQGGFIVSNTWSYNNRTGGVVAMLVKGPVNITGNAQIKANARGFTGGSSRNTACTAVPSSYDDATGADKGESIAATRVGATGHGSIANGGGGGRCSGGGGAGGSNVGVGGKGGNTAGGSPGAEGGGSLTFSPIDHLLMGGGGGGGHGDGASSGLRGGGIVFLRAQSFSATALSGSGVTLLAEGQFFAGDFRSTGAAGGGGGGGTIHFRSAQPATCGAVGVSGSNGGDTSTIAAPGGGGGGGAILLQPASANCATKVTGGVAGDNGIFTASGATKGNDGAVTTLAGNFALPGAARVTSPAASLVTANTRPTLSGTAPASIWVAIYLGSVRAAVLASNSSGQWTYTPSQPLADGAYALRVASEALGVASAKSAPLSLTIDTTPPTTLISSKPPSATKSTSATFTFTSSEGAVSFECAVDGAAAFTPCASPLVLDGLAQGTHSLKVRSKDAAGNVDPNPASASWSITDDPQALADAAAEETPEVGLAGGGGCSAGASAGASALPLMLVLGAASRAFRRRA
jgi:hypothetical protein